MLQFKPHIVDDVIVADFIVPSLTEGFELDDSFERLRMSMRPGGVKNMVIDLSRVGFIASSALSLLIRLKQVVDLQGGQFAICGLRKQVQMVFRLSGLDRSLTLHATRDEALAALGAMAE